jgi:hypothetical protein
MVDQVAGLVEVLVAVPLGDRDEEDLEEVRVHPVRDLEQVVQAFGVD